MKHDISTTVHLLSLVLIVGILTLLIAPYAVVEGATLAEQNPFIVAGILIGSIAGGTFVLMKVKKLKNLVWLDALMVFAFSEAITMLARMFFDLSNWELAGIFGIVYIGIYYGLLRSMQKDEAAMRWVAPIWNIVMAFAFLGIGIKLGYMLPVWMSILILMVAAIYDYWAVFKSKVMVNLANFMMGRKLFPGFFVWKKDSPPAILGGGDVFFIVLMVTALLKVSVTYAWLGMIGMFAGLVWLFAVSERKKFYPAIPPIAAGLFVGVLVAMIASMWVVV